MFCEFGGRRPAEIELTYIGKNLLFHEKMFSSRVDLYWEDQFFFGMGGNP